MSTSHRPFPPFSWSHSRDRTLLDCTRAYFWRYYGSHGGWLSGADTETRLAYVLKNLTALPLVLGSAIHDCARNSVLAVQRGDPRPSVDVMLAHVTTALNAAVLGSHHRGRFEADPKRVTMLRDAWYAGRIDPHALPAAVARARTCLRHLEGASIWDDLQACSKDRIAIVDSPETFVHTDIPVYAGPDLVYRPRGRVVVVDWKTGDETDAEMQLALYALYVRKALGLRHREGQWFGRVINLFTGADTLHELSRLDLLRAAERIRDSASAMYALLRDRERNEPLDRAAFALAPDAQRSLCSRCSFFELCQGELERMASAP